MKSIESEIKNLRARIRRERKLLAERARLLGQLERIQMERAQQSADDRWRMLTIKVAHAFHLAPAALRKRTQRLEIVRPRQVAMYLLRRMTPQPSCQAVADYFGGFDHGAVLHSEKAVATECEVNAKFREFVERLEKE